MVRSKAKQVPRASGTAKGAAPKAGRRAAAGPVSAATKGAPTGPPRASRSARRAAKAVARPVARPERADAGRVIKRRVRLETDERRAQLLGLARRVFTESAYDDVSIDDIAAAAGISKGLLYHYFPTKRDLYVAGLRETANELVAAVTAVIDHQAPPAERVRAGLDAYLSHVLAAGGVFVALMRGGVGSDPEVASVVEATRQAFLDQFLVQSPMAQVLAADPLVRLAVRGWIGMVEATSIEWVSHPTIEREAVRDMLVDNLLAALTNPRIKLR